MSGWSPTHHRLTALLVAALVCGDCRNGNAAGVVGFGTPESCTEDMLDVALTEGGEVTFDCGGDATIRVTATKVLSEDTIIDGEGYITLDGGHAVRVLSVEPGTTVELSGVRVANGYSHYESGAGIRNLGILTVHRSTLSGNFAWGFGGGIDNEGDCTVFESTFVDNQGGNGGGGISNFRQLAVRGSTFFRNVSGVMVDESGDLNEPGNGGGITNYGTLLVSNSTFTGNTAISNDHPFYPARASGGAIHSEGELIVANCTLTRNRAPDGSCGGIDAGPNATIKNTLIANNLNASCCTDYGLRSDSTSNLHDDLYPRCGASFAMLPAGALRLRGLADNGGSTLTVEILPGSAAAGGGDVETCRAAAGVGGVDQRGAPRFGASDLACDVGAFEARVGPTPTPAMTFVSLQGVPGEYISGGMNWLLTLSDYTLVANHLFGEVRLELHGLQLPSWFLDFAAPAGQELLVGEYAPASRYSFQPLGESGLSVTGAGRGCAHAQGAFAVREATYAIDGTVESFAADFAQQCDGSEPLLFGSVRLSSNVPTARPPMIRATPTPTRIPPTATEVPPPCYSDCNHDGRITVDELITGVTIALGRTTLSVCPLLDSDANQIVSVSELVAAVDAALFGCVPL